MASSDSQVDKPQRGRPKRDELRVFTCENCSWKLKKNTAYFEMQYIFASAIKEMFSDFSN